MRRAVRALLIALALLLLGEIALAVVRAVIGPSEEAVAVVVRVVNASERDVTVSWTGPNAGSDPVSPCTEHDLSLPVGDWRITITTASGSPFAQEQSVLPSGPHYVGFLVSPNGSVSRLTSSEAGRPPTLCASGSPSGP